MDVSSLIWLIVGGVILIGVIVAFYFNKDYLQYANIFTPILKSALMVLQAVGGLMPDNSVITTAVQVISVAIEAAGYAEKLWLDGDIEKDNRPDSAKEYIASVLSKANIEISDSLQSIINGIIALTCYLMPHYDTETETDSE